MDSKKPSYIFLFVAVAFLAGGFTMWVWDHVIDKPRYVYQLRNLQQPFLTSDEFDMDGPLSDEGQVIVTPPKSAG